MQIEEADVARKIRLDEFTSSEEKITNKIPLWFFYAFFCSQYAFKYAYFYKRFSW